MTVPIIETTIDPKQPRRFEKKANIFCIRVPLSKKRVSVVFLRPEKPASPRVSRFSVGR